MYNQQGIYYMEGQDARAMFFKNQMKMIRAEELTNILRCQLCMGLYRFAHTLIECGHTFCQQCIFAYIKGFKGRNPEVRCPQCHSAIETNYQKSIMKDVFKQSLVDMLEPAYAEEEKLIIRRVQRLFPSFDLEFLLDQFDLQQSSKVRRKTEEKSQVMSMLPNKVKETLGVSFQQFTQMIVKQEHFANFLEIVTKKREEQPTVVDLKPKTERDFLYIGINNKMKMTNSVVAKIRKFLQKKLLMKMQESQQFTKELINPNTDGLNIRIELVINGVSLNDDQKIAQIKGIEDYPVYYSLI